MLFAALGLWGCGVYYWTKPASTFADFAQDHRDCVRGSATMPDPTKVGYGVVNESIFRICMKGRGWARSLSPSAEVPAGYFRGVEDEDTLVKLDEIPRQPKVTQTAK